MILLPFLSTFTREKFPCTSQRQLCLVTVNHSSESLGTVCPIYVDLDFSSCYLLHEWQLYSFSWPNESFLSSFNMYVCDMWHVYMNVSMSRGMHVWGERCTYSVWAHMLRSEVDGECLSQLFSTLFTECLNEPTAHCFWLVWLSNMAKKFPASLYLPCADIAGSHLMSPAFMREPNSSSHTIIKRACFTHWATLPLSLKKHFQILKEMKPPM